ncbi:MAG: SDR family NAD(P)-dependent oxidoreductase, partial [Gammaproteobacteria bacterium]|nr:SDR family NAD(P)-dependent oxidoreductase [Gammaproteobacteria bacterium]
MTNKLSRNSDSDNARVALITGAAHRIGATTAKLLHQNGMNIVLHYRGSREKAQALQNELNKIRENSVILIQA